MIHHETDFLAQAKRAFPLSRYMAENGFGESAKKSARCPFHQDSSASFSLYVGDDGEERWHCFAGCGQGDAIDFLAKLRGLSNADACREYIRLAGVAVPPRQSARTEKPLDWPQCVLDFAPDHAARFGKWRSLSPEFVAWLHARQLIGLFRNRLAFPVHDASGAVVRAHVRAVKRQPDGSENVFWFYTPKGPGLPLIIGDARSAAKVWAFESQFDMLAALDLASWHKSPDGLPGIAAVATRGAENGKRLAGLFSPDATLILFPQNDPPRPDRAETPAQKWTREAAAHCGCKTVHLVPTPGDFKDLNDALRAGLTPEEFQAALAAALPYTPLPDLHAARPGNVSKPVITLPPEESEDADAPPALFPLGMLPSAMALMAAGVARTARVPDRLSGVCVLGIVSAAIGAGLEVQADAPPAKPLRGNLFLLVSAETGTGKTRTFELIAVPLLDYQERLQEHWRKEFGPRLQSQIKAAEAKIKRLEKDIAKENDADECERLRGQLQYKLAERDELFRQNAQPVIIAQDATTERLTAMVEEQGEVLFSASSDCRKVVSNVLGRYTKDSSGAGGKETDETFYLAGYSGDHVRVDRGSRPPVNLRRPCLGLLWFGQPDLVDMMLARDSLSASGFLPRLLICHSHAAPQRIDGETQAISENVLAQWSKLVTDLLTAYHKTAVHHLLLPVPEARQKFVDYHNAIVERRKTELHDVTGFAARWCENSWRLAVVLHAGLYGADAHNHPLESETAENAIRLSEWFANEQLDILAKGRRQAAAKLEEQVLELLETNRERKGQDFTTAREIQRAHIVASADAARALLDRMERDGLLTGEDIKPAHGGKTTRIFRATANGPLPG